jgi:protein TonB
VLRIRSSNLSRYVALSSLLHLLFIAWVLRYVHQTSQGAHLHAPVRVTIVAPALPAGPMPGMSNKPPVPSPTQPHPAMPNLPPPVPSPLMATRATALPVLSPASTLPPPARDIDRQLPVAGVSASARVPELSPFLTPRPPIQSPAPTVPPKAPESAPSPIVTNIPKPAAPAPEVPVPSQSVRPPVDRPDQERVTLPRPQVSQRVPSPPRTVTKTSPPRVTPAQAPDAHTPAAVVVPAAPTPTQNVPPPRTLPMRRKPVEVPRTTPTQPPVNTLPSVSATPTPHTPPVYQLPPARPRISTSAPAASVSTAPAPAVPSPSVPPSTQPSRPSADRPVQERVTLPQPQVPQHVPSPPRAVAKTPSFEPPPANTRSPEPTILRPDVPPAHQPPPSAVATIPLSPMPQRQTRDDQSQEVIDTPRLTPRTPGSSLPSRAGLGKPTLFARRQPTFETPPRFIHQPKPVYPRTARRQGWEGTVVLDIEMLADGTVGDIKIAKSSGYPVLDQAAQKAVKKWRHIPVQSNGTAVTRRANLPIRFQLN